LKKLGNRYWTLNGPRFDMIITGCRLQETNLSRGRRVLVQM
jgi:hypothetical protein